MSDEATIHGHDKVLEHTIELFRSFTPPGVTLQLPPPSAKEMDMQFEEYVPGQSLTATVVAPPSYANAVGILQGGFISAMFDNLIGPLSYLTARGPTTSLELGTHFMRTVVTGERLKLTATVRKPGRSVIYLVADAHNKDDKLVATAVSTVQVLTMPKP
ncbi:PaaI family thioesterase [Nocardia suismassiliense]|uniref:PaaI family thioesterase n=1 Tax=Nocardia suismassiliense TaxID=2077092 RepID=UPI00131F0919|nr:PaaI family thioesterase [Nocardia suismassiliense]